MPRRGGRYEGAKGKRPVRVEGTEDHPDGNRARGADGVPLYRPTGKPAPAVPAKEPKAATPPAEKED